MKTITWVILGLAAGSVSIMDAAPASKIDDPVAFVQDGGEGELAGLAWRIRVLS